MSVLLLNGDYTPLEAISVERAMVLLITEKVEVVHAKVDKYIRTIKEQFPFPEVVRLKWYVYIKRKSLSPSKRNVFERDEYTCQYCGSKRNLTIDHVLPISRGGENTWKNMVTCCWKCNNIKGNKTPEEAGMKLFSEPSRPTFFHVLKVYSKEKNLISWNDYIFNKQ